MKSNNKTAPKVFKFRTLTLNEGEKLHFVKKHNLKKITTREYYSGKHAIEIQINGIPMSALPWNLKV